MTYYSTIENPYIPHSDEEMGMKILIKTHTNQIVSLSVQPNDTIWSVKEKIHEYQSQYLPLAPLEFGGMILDNSKTLNDYNVNTNSTLNVVVARTCSNDTRVRIDWRWNSLGSDHKAGPNGRGYFLTGHIHWQLPKSNIRSGAQLIKIGNVDVTNLEYTRIVSSLNQFLRSEWSSDHSLTFQNIPDHPRSQSNPACHGNNERYHPADRYPSSRPQHSPEPHSDQYQVSAVDEIESDILEMNCAIVDHDTQLKEIKELLKEITSNQMRGQQRQNRINHMIIDVFNALVKEIKVIKDEFKSNVDIEANESEMKVSNAENVQKKMDNIGDELAHETEPMMKSGANELTEPAINANELKDNQNKSSAPTVENKSENTFVDQKTESVEIAVYNAEDEETEQKMGNGGNELTQPESKAETNINANKLTDSHKMTNAENSKRYLDIPSHMIGEYLMVYNKCIENKGATRTKDEIMAYLLSIGVKKENIKEKHIRIAFWKDHLFTNIKLTGKHVQDAIWKAKLFKEKASTLIEKGWKVRIYVNYDDRSKLRTNTRKQNNASNVQTNQMRIIPFGVAGVGGFSVPPLPLPAINLPFPAAGLPMPMPMPMINNNFTPMGYSINQNQNM